MPKGPESLEPIVDRVVGHVVDAAKHRSGGDYGFQDVQRWMQIERAWLPTLDGFITERVTPVGFRRGTLYVSCSSAAMEQELVYIKDLIIERMRSVLPDIAIKDIKSGLKPPSAPATEASEEPSIWLDAPNTEEEVRYAEKSTEGLEPELAEALKRTILLALRAERLGR